MSEFTFQYQGGHYPDYIRRGNACAFIAPAALHFCRGKGLDVGAGKWPLPGAIPVDVQAGGDAMSLPAGDYNFVFSSHCLEHLANPVAALEHWKTRLRAGGVLFLYLPHPQMVYWRPQHCRKHLHSWQPREIAQMLSDLGFVNIVHSDGYDAYWSFFAVGFAPVPNVAPSPDSAFRWLVNESADHVHADPQFAAVFKRFGADAFRRSSAVEPAFETLIKAGGFRGKRCVEIGTFNGITALVLSRYFEEVVSIDIFPHTLKHALMEFCGVKNVRFVDAKDNAEKAKVIAALDFDAAYVDGDHQNDTATDFALLERCGRVLFHEYWEQQKPVWDLVNSLRGRGTVQVEGKFALWTAARG